MDPQYLSLGMGGIVALLVLREVFAFLRRRNGVSAGAKPECWQDQQVQRQTEALKSAFVPILDHQVQILQELRTLSNRQVESMIRLQMTLDEVKQRQEAIQVLLDRNRHP